MCSPEYAGCYQISSLMTSGFMLCWITLHSLTSQGDSLQSVRLSEAAGVNCAEQAHFTHSALCFITSGVQRTVEISSLSVINQYL